MTVELVRDALLWRSIINIAFLLFWGLLFMFAHDLVYRVHTKLFKLSTETFDAIHYSGMAIYKLAIFMFNIIPYIALLIVGTK